MLLWRGLSYLHLTVLNFISRWLSGPVVTSHSHRSAQTPHRQQDVKRIADPVYFEFLPRSPELQPLQVRYRWRLELRKIEIFCSHKPREKAGEVEGAVYG